MNKRIGGLIVAAVALGILALRNARRALTSSHEAQHTPPPTQQPPANTPRPEDRGVIQRNEPIDDGIAVRSPFKGDPGIVSHARTNGRS